ncbi:MAG: transcription termination/antitermination NusG family protein [candidate division KSB1 bacterium]|nr:transcription termination/antitermination NusG family protein [candidate division KSB1 bacterium]
MVSTSVSQEIPERWYAIYCKSRHDVQVRNRLKSKGIQTYLAEYRTRVRWGQRIRKVTRNLLPGYVLVRIQLTPKNYLRVLQTQGVVRFIDKPWPHVPWIPDEQVDSLRLLLNSNCPFEEVPYWDCGEEVEIIAGALKGLQGKVVEFSKKKNIVVVSIDLLKRSVAVEINAALLRRKKKILVA